MTETRDSLKGVYPFLARLAIAASLEHAYEPLPIQAAAELLYFSNTSELITFAHQVRNSRS